MNDRYLIAIMAAGESKRLGQPKQLLKIQDSSLICRMVKECLKITSADTAVVIGAFPDSMRKELDTFQGIQILENENWQTGLSSSIKLAAQKAQTARYTAIILVLCDQIYMKAENISTLIAKHKQKSVLVASKYKIGQGPPVLFDTRFYPELIANESPNGAKELIKNYQEILSFTNFDLGHIDLDTPDDLARLDGLSA